MKIQTMVERPSIFFHKKSKIDMILAVRLEGLLGQGIKVGCFFFKWTLGLAFGGFTLSLAEGSNSYIVLVNFNPFLWTLNKVWPFNPTTSQLRQP
jgi:hypothetical protein